MEVSGGMAKESLDWKQYLNPEESQCLKEIDDWVYKEPSIWSAPSRWLGKPTEFMYRKIPVFVKSRMSKVIYAAIGQVRSVSLASINEEKIRNKLCEQMGRELNALEDVYKCNVRDCDKVAWSRLGRAKSASLVTGGVTGAAGLVGMGVDLPTLYFRLCKVISEIAMCYGFDPRMEKEWPYMLKILDMGHYADIRERREGMVVLESLDDMIEKNLPLEDLERVVLTKGVQIFSKRLAAKLFQRKAAQSISFVGAFVGGLANRQMTNDVGLSAYYAYRRRYLKRVGLIRSSTLEL